MRTHVLTFLSWGADHVKAPHEMTWKTTYGNGVARGAARLAVAPLGAALGMPFALGLQSLGRGREGFIPWAWALNGAFSVVATPLANWLALSAGYRLVLALSLGIYALAWALFPGAKRKS